jgi:hypothetical protein
MIRTFCPVETCRTDSQSLPCKQHPIRSFALRWRRNNKKCRRLIETHIYAEARFQIWPYAYRYNQGRKIQRQITRSELSLAVCYVGALHQLFWEKTLCLRGASGKIPSVVHRRRVSVKKQWNAKERPHCPMLMIDKSRVISARNRLIMK